MLQATKPQSLTFREVPSFSEHNNTNVSFIIKQETCSRFIKLRPKSQTIFSNSFSFNLQQKNLQKTPVPSINHDYTEYQSLFLINDSNYWQKQTRRTSLQKSFKEDSQTRKMDNFLDTSSLLINLKPVMTQEQNMVQKRSKVIKLKRPKKQYSPICKLLELQNSKKTRISLLSKQVSNK